MQGARLGYSSNYLEHFVKIYICQDIAIDVGTAYVGVGCMQPFCMWAPTCGFGVCVLSRTVNASSCAGANRAVVKF